ncbi:GNAT family N-acetyltransferase [Nonomuraea maritima]|uniref:GNAT family N-acetyltransferase n=1 Tax=Nonomuraea maritima TaxID=683260 RepID=UPI003710DF2A
MMHLAISVSWCKIRVGALKKASSNMTDVPVVPKRFRLDVRLPQAVPAHDFRHPVEADIPALGQLMWDAYRGTPDEEDAGGSVAEATEEIRLTFTGEHGPFLPTASFVADDGAQPVGAALVTVWKDVPLLAYVFTAPSHAGRGLGRRLIEAAMHALGEQGYPLLSLAATEDNVRARRLYASLGFTPH